MQEEIVAKFGWLGQKLGLASKRKDDDDVDGADRTTSSSVAGPSAQPPSVAGTGLPPAPRPAVGGPSFNTPMPVYAVSGGRMYPRYSGGGPGVTKLSGLKPGNDSPLTKRAAAVLAAASSGTRH